jgi:HEAT repeat protein
MRWTAICVAAVLVAACSTSTPTEAPTARPTLGATIPELIAALSDSDPEIRLEAAERLGTIGDPQAVPALADAALDDDIDVALAAIAALASIGGDDATGALVDLTATVPDDGDYEAEDRLVAAIVALGRVGGAVAIARLLELKVDEDMGGTAWMAVDEAVEALSADDVSAVAAALGHDETAVRLEAIACLGAIGGPDAVEALIDQVGSKDPEIRMAAIDALAEAGDPKATATLVKALSDDDAFAAASRALVEIHRADASPLLKYLKSKSTRKVYYPLIRIGQKGTEDALVTALGKYGYKDMAVDYLNCGNATLEKAARRWASRHGYTVITLPGGSSVTWGG